MQLYIAWWVGGRVHWIIYRGPGFLAVVWFGSSPTPSPVSKLSPYLSFLVCRRSSLLTVEGGAKSYDGEEAWSSINNSIPSRGGLKNLDKEKRELSGRHRTVTEWINFKRHVLYQERHVESPLYSISYYYFSFLQQLCFRTILDFKWSTKHRMGLDYTH
jgi:hypothetical protein